MTVVAARGFRASAVAAGLKSSGQLDLAVVVNDGPTFDVAGVFTRNRVVAAPVTWSRGVVAARTARAVVLNSGGANACTGSVGYADAVATAHAVGRHLFVPADQVAVASTGLIGERLAMSHVVDGVAAACAGLADGAAPADGGADAARAIMTTDTVPKTTRVEADGFVVGGMAKGAGMLAPGLATMLSVITTDARADAAALDRALRTAAARTFDRVDSDGCMSTNDTVLLLASGASGRTPDDVALGEAVFAAASDLARQLVGDAEGSSKDIAVEVRGAACESDAVEVARAVARNNLFKCAVFGNDPNWGRVLAAVGTTAAAFDPASLDVSMNGVLVCRAGGVGEDRSLVDLAGREVHVVVDLHAGGATATIWTNDLTHDYVHENSAYST